MAQAGLSTAGLGHPCPMKQLTTALGFAFPECSEPIFVHLVYVLHKLNPASFCVHCWQSSLCYFSVSRTNLSAFVTLLPYLSHYQLVPVIQFLNLQKSEG